MLINSGNYADANTYYKDTYCKFKESGDELWHIDQVTSTCIYCTNLKGEKGGVELYDTGYPLDFAIPKRVTYQYGNNAVHLSRVPARMWKKGIHSKNTTFSLLGDNGNWLQSNFDPNLIEGFINKPCYSSFANGVQAFESDVGLSSVALTPRLAMARNGRIYLDQTYIAHFDGTCVIVKKIFASDIQKITSFPIKEIK